MRYLSVCSGIEAATVAWHPLGWTPVAFSEIESFPCKVLAHHYPNTPNLGDMTKFKEWPNYDDIDLLVGGTPCQSFSVAGLRKGLDDPRGNLMLTYLAISDRYKPKWIVWENVPGVLSSNGGRDFGTFLGAMEKLGYGFAYRVFDAQFVRTDGYPYAVPQRRRRVFVVGCLGDWGRAAAVLFDSESLRGNPPPSRKAGQGVAGTIGARTSGGGGLGTDFDLAGGLQPVCMSHGQANAEISVGAKPTLNCNHEQPITFGIPGNWIGRLPENGGNAIEPMLNVAPCQTKTDVHAVVFQQNTRDEVRLMNGDGQICGALAAQAGMKQQNYVAFNDVGATLKGCKQGSGTADPSDGNGHNIVGNGMQVRRLTPRECERLQAFPDDYTNVPGASDTTRYRALGNSMAVNVMQLIGERIQYVESML